MLLCLAPSDIKKKAQTDDSVLKEDGSDCGSGAASDSGGLVRTEPSDKSDSSRTTSSRSCASRSSGRKKNKIQMLEEYYRRKAAENGE